MDGECYFCHGLVSPLESGHIVLEDHAKHEVYMHERCAVGHDVVEDSPESPGSLEIQCPECGVVETH